jgi:hypothetical protein
MQHHGRLQDPELSQRSTPGDGVRPLPDRQGVQPDAVWRRVLRVKRRSRERGREGEAGECEAAGGHEGRRQPPSRPREART